jgi:two-component system chemotaxis response regulator CheB
MTGMGQDGASGLLALRQAGWTTIGQDEASCAIYGMPRAAMQFGAVEREYPLAQLGAALVAACEGRLPAKARV